MPHTKTDFQEAFQAEPDAQSHGLRTTVGIPRAVFPSVCEFPIFPPECVLLTRDWIILKNNKNRPPSTNAHACQANGRQQATGSNVLLCELQATATTVVYIPGVYYHRCPCHPTKMCNVSDNPSSNSYTLPET